MVDSAGVKLLRCVVVTPERAVLDEQVDSVILPLFDGELGVLPGRAPLIGRLGFGELRLRRGERLQRYFVDGGFAQVNADTVTVLTDRAVKPQDINIESAEQALALSTLLAETPEAQEANFNNAERARAQLRVAEHRTETEQA
jgi:F-type H+-transporting ATPase subunit epsilon